MLFRNMFLKYMQEADAPAGAGVVAPAAPDAVVIGPGAGKEAAADEVAKAADEVNEPQKEEPKKSEQQQANTEDMDKYIQQYAEGNPALSLALSFLKDAGIKPTDPAFSMAETQNDFSLLEAILSQKGLPGTDHMVGILKGAVAQAQAAEAEAHKATDELVRGVLGDDTDTIVDWAAQNATPEEAEAIDNMLSAGGAYARACAIMLREAYGSSGATIPAKAVVPAKPNTPSNVGVMDARTFAAKSNELYAKYGNDFKQTQEYHALSSARNAARAKGL